MSYTPDSAGAASSSRDERDDDDTIERGGRTAADDVNPRAPVYTVGTRTVAPESYVHATVRCVCRRARSTRHCNRPSPGKSRRQNRTRNVNESPASPLSCVCVCALRFHFQKSAKAVRFRRIFGKYRIIIIITVRFIPGTKKSKKTPKLLTQIVFRENVFERNYIKFVKLSVKSTYSWTNKKALHFDIL